MCLLASLWGGSQQSRHLVLQLGQLLILPAEDIHDVRVVSRTGLWWSGQLVGEGRDLLMLMDWVMGEERNLLMVRERMDLLMLRNLTRERLDLVWKTEPV